MGPAGVPDNDEDSITYLRGATAGSTPDDRLTTYVEWAPKMLEWVCKHTRLKVVSLPEYADYYPRIDGSKPGGRTVEAEYFHGRELGDELLKLRPSGIQTLMLGRICFTAAEARTLLCRSPGWILLSMKLMLRYWLDIPWRFKSKRDRNLAMGNGLVAPLRASLADRNIPLWLDTPAKELVVEDDRVVGLVVEKAGKPIRIHAKRGVILGAGGFEGSQKMREKYLPNPTHRDWSAANPENTGDAINMGLKLGAALDHMDDAWWGPVTVVPGEDRARMLVIEKSLPGSILVNKAGQRFVNEAAPYVDVVNAMYEWNTEEAPSVPAFLIFDARFRRSYPCGPFLQSSQQPDWAISKLLKQKDYLKKADTLDELAAQLGINADGLKATVEKVNEYARTGKDLDFNRGDTIFDRYYGDLNVKPNPCLAPIVEGPFYALESFPGELGTKGGLRADVHSQVLKESGDAIPGLYAIGNCSSPLAGRTYPGAGGRSGRR